jgi:hypothetical protein
MTYAVTALVFLLVIGAGIAFFVMAGTRDSQPSVAEDSDRSDATPFSGSGDHTPMGDTAEHAGDQTEAGETVGDQDAQEHGGTGGPTSGPHATGRTPGHVDEEPGHGRFKRDPIGGEAEGEPIADVGEVPHPRRS